MKMRTSRDLLDAFQIRHPHCLHDHSSRDTPARSSSCSVSS